MSVRKSLRLPCSKKFNSLVTDFQNPLASLSLGKSGGVVSWQAGLLESCLRFLHVVLHPAHQQEMAFVVIEGVGGPGIAITGLADGADIHGVALGGIEAHGRLAGGEASDAEGLGILFPDGRDMGVPVEADEGALRGKVGLGLRDLVDVVELSRLVQGCMGEGDRIQIRRDRKILEPSEVLLAHLLLGDPERIPNRFVPILIEDLVGQQEHRLVVAQDGDRTEIPNLFHALSRLGSVPDDITQAKDAPDRKIPDVLKDSIKGIDVGMDITDEGEEAAGGFGR